MRQLKYIGAVFAALMLFTACEKEFDAIPEDFATVPEGSDEAWPQTVTIKDHRKFRYERGPIYNRYDRFSQRYHR